MVRKEQVEDAIADFHGLIAEGQELATALHEAAVSNGITAFVLQTRLSKTMPLEALVDRIRFAAGREQTYALIYRLVFDYCCEDIKWYKRSDQIRQEMLARVEAAVGHPLSTSEKAQADTAYKKAKEEISILFQREYERALRAGQDTPLNAQH